MILLEKILINSLSFVVEYMFDSVINISVKLIESKNSKKSEIYESSKESPKESPKEGL